MDWTHLAQDHEKWQDLMNKAMNLGSSIKRNKFPD
jgi:hypothetical protein